MSLSDLANASNERRQQNIMRLNKDFHEHEVITVAQAATRYAVSFNTAKKWAKDGNIPLMVDNNHTVVPWTKENKPRDMSDESNPGDGFIEYVKRH